MRSLRVPVPRELQEPTLHRDLPVTSQMLSKEMVRTPESDLRSLQLILPTSQLPSLLPDEPSPGQPCQVIGLRPKFPLDKRIELFFNVPFCTVAFLSLIRDNLLM